MDEEAQIILSDAIAFCQRDGIDKRLVNMLSQSRGISLTDDALVIEAPSRFAYTNILKNREVIERYLEEIAFCPLALNVTVPAAPGVVGTAAGAAAAPVAGTQAATDPAAQPASPEATATAAPAHVSRETTAAAAAPTAAMPSAAPAGEMPVAEAGTATNVTVKNTMTPDAFRKMVAQMNGGTTPAVSSRGPEPDPAAAQSTWANDAAAPVEDAAPSPAYSKFTFENFVYGEENKHAYRSALRFAAVADEPGACTSLFIYGNSGLGKTHLLLAIKNELSEKKPWIRVKYANSQAYIDDFINEVAVQKTAGGGILREYHAADVLIIDDIQNIIGKTASIDYFFRLMDEFIRDNKKVVIASDRAPKKLGMDERLTSRFNAGMLCLVSEPGFEMKYAILTRFYETTLKGAGAGAAGGDSLLSTAGDIGHLSDAQLRHMAEVSGTNIRELESFCQRCANDSWDREQEGRELTAEDIDRIANEYFDIAHKKIHIDTVQAVVEEFYHVTHEELIGPRRNANIAFARHVAIYLAIDMCEMTTPMVGAEFGGRDHSTVLNSIKVIEKKIKNDRGLVEDLQALRNKISLKS